MREIDAILEAAAERLARVAMPFQVADPGLNSLVTRDCSQIHNLLQRQLLSADSVAKMRP